MIEAAGVRIGAKWYPLLRVLDEQLRETHPWQVPSVDGLHDAERAIDAAVRIARELIDQGQQGWRWWGGPPHGSH